jgi:hypothetical protein
MYSLFGDIPQVNRLAFIYWLKSDRLQPERAVDRQENFYNSQWFTDALNFLKKEFGEGNINNYIDTYIKKKK